MALYKKSRILLFTLFTFAFTLCYGQDKISGKVVDAKTKEGLPYASIYLSDAPGTLTNEDGEYDLRNPHTGYVKVQCLGYETLQMDISELTEVIKLKPKAYDIKTVTITAVDINKLISRLRSKYYPILQNDEKYRNRMYFYRQTTSNDDHVNELVEAFFKGNPNLYVHKLQLLEGRYAALPNDSINNRELMHSNFFDFSCIAPIGDQEKPWIKFINENWAKYYSVDIETVKDTSGVVFYKMHFTAKKKVKKDIVEGTLYVNPKSLLVYKYEGHIKNFNYKSTGLGIMKHQCPTFTIEYDTESLLPRVRSVKVDEDYKFTYFLALGKRKYHVKISSILVAVDDMDELYSKYDMGASTEIQGKDDLTEKIDAQPYDSLFWENNPIIKRTPLEDSTTKIFREQGLFGNYKSVLE
ncbi:MAG: carboxypeptidase-like regulatory domain-containing protein [Bacteroidaceae bacterium]|nr:carboxypeptidase-like regulatory domain-containing protein [Bacteroidaceae bacterium]